MINDGVLPGDFVGSADCAEIIRSAGIQLGMWANDIAFTDAAFGEDWALETANRMGALSELLHALYEVLPAKVLRLVVPLPEGVSGVIAINPNYKEDVTKTILDDEGTAITDIEDDLGLGDFPF